VLWVLREELQHQRLQRLGYFGPHLSQRHRRLVQVAVEHAEGRRPGEGDVAADQFVEQHAERVEVRTGADGAAHGLLGGHVGGRADGGAGVGEPGRVRVEHRGDAQVEDGDRTVGPDHHIAGLEVAVDDRHRVHGGQHGAQLRGDGDRPGPGVRIVLGEMVGEVGALDVLHDQVQLVAVAAGVVDGDQAGVVDLGGDPALALEAAAQFGDVLAAGDLVGAQQLDGDAAVEAAVVRGPDLAHAALADDRGQLVTAGDDPPVH
jgi:hypothetical protein